jgi:hypothetical protein
MVDILKPLLHILFIVVFLLQWLHLIELNSLTFFVLYSSIRLQVVAKLVGLSLGLDENIDSVLCLIESYILTVLLKLEIH